MHCGGGGFNVLGSVASVVHQEELDVVDVADQEGLVAGGRQVTGLLVGAIADLHNSPIVSPSALKSPQK